MSNCKWLPDTFRYPDWNNYKAYEDELYTIFKDEIINGNLNFRGKPVIYRRHPIENGKEEGFYHCTCKNYTTPNDRMPDPERMIRLPWLSALVINYACNDTCCSDKPIIWKQLHKNNYRYYLYFRRYLVILEERERFFVLITGFYVEEEYYHRSLIKDSQKPENAIY